MNRAKLVQEIAHDMFNEYNSVADDYNLTSFLSQQELETVLDENLEDEQLEKLQHDIYGRHALAGQIAALLCIEDIENSVIIIEGVEGGLTADDITDDIKEALKPKKPTTH